MTRGRHGRARSPRGRALASRPIAVRRLVLRIASLRRRHPRPRVVLANGLFDLMHVGHVRYLRAARSLGEILVVAVNDDRSARRLRGPGRPIMGDADRARVVAALEGVDFVVLFGDRTVAPLVRRLRPDIQCKGTDYTPSTVPEGKTVRSHGGTVRIVGDRKRHASTDLIRRIALRLRRRAQRSHRPVT